MGLQPLNQANSPIFPSRTNFLSQKKADVITSVMVKQLSVDTSSPAPLRVKETGTIDKAALEKEIASSVAAVSQMTHHYEQLKKTAETSGRTQTISGIVQYIVSDIVLKGSAYSVEAGLPLLFNTSAHSLEGLVPSTEIIKIATDVLDLGSGVASIFYKSQLIETVKAELDKLREKRPPLDPGQLARLEKLEKIVNYESELLSSQKKEQGIRSFKNFFSYITFVISWVQSDPISQQVLNSANTLISGVSTALNGLFFYRAHRDLKEHRNWSADYKNWMQQQTLTISNEPTILKETQKKVQQVLTMRKERHDKQVENLRNKLKNGEIDITTIHQRLIEMKRPGLKQKNLSKDQFSLLLTEKLGVPLDAKVVEALRKEYLKQRQLEQTTHLNRMLKLETKCLQNWIKHQSLDQVLSMYVEHQAVLNTTIKQSLGEMVQKKHQIEKSFMKMKHLKAGLQFSASTILFSAALALGIIALVTNPVGAAVLILASLSVASSLLTMALISATYYQSHTQKPNVTAASLKGAYVQLYYYYTRAALASLKEKIGEYVSATIQEVSQQIFSKKPMIDKRVETESQSWSKQADTLYQELEALTWKDFASKADLKVAEPIGTSFDTLETLQQLLTHCDLEQLSTETKTLLEKYLGINVASLQNDIQKDPLSVKQMLRSFFNMYSDAFAKFVGQQNL